jgi:hypothetical protein
MPKYIKKVLKAGRYLVNTLDGKERKEESYSPERLQHFADQYNEMHEAGLKVPSPWSHDQNGPVVKKEDLANSKNNAGWWNLFVDKDGDLSGEVDVPLKEDSKRIGTTVKEVSPLIRKKFVDGSGRIWEDVITHVALVTHPIQAGQDEFKPVANAEEVSIAMSCYLGPLDDEDSSATDPSQDKSGDPKTDNTGDPKSEPYSVTDALKCLRGAGIDLPEDTMPDNLIERIVVACRAIKGKEREDTKNDDPNQVGPNGAKEQPQPIAMGDTTMTDVQVTKQLESYKNLAQTTVKGSLVNRIKSLIDSGRISTAYAKEHLEPLVTGYQLSLTDDGAVEAGQLELAISLIEKMPVNNYANGNQFFGGPKPAEGSAALSIFEEGNPNLGEQVVTEGDELDKMVDAQLRAAGY